MRSKGASRPTLLPEPSRWPRPRVHCGASCLGGERALSPGRVCLFSASPLRPPLPGPSPRAAVTGMAGVQAWVSRSPEDPRDPWSCWRACPCWLRSETQLFCGSVPWLQYQRTGCPWPGPPHTSQRPLPPSPIAQAKQELSGQCSPGSKSTAIGPARLWVPPTRARPGPQVGG